MQKDETDSTEYKNGSLSFACSKDASRKVEERIRKKGLLLFEQLTLILKWIQVKSLILLFGCATVVVAVVVGVAAAAAAAAAMENADMRSFSPNAL